MIRSSRSLRLARFHSKRHMALFTAVVTISLTTTNAIALPLDPVDDNTLQNPPDADWLMWRRTLDAHGYSPLTQINRENVETLGLAWAHPLTDGAPQEGTPLVHQGVMFMPNPRDVIQALDAATGDLVWEYRRPLPDDVDQIFAFPATNRNLAIYGSLIIDTGVDDTIYALDVNTGELAWETEILDYRSQPAHQSSGPIVADGKLISGRGCLPPAGPAACIITAHDALTGEELWRTRTIEKAGDDEDSWGTVADAERTHVGAWMIPSYDPELELVYIGTSVTSPSPKFLLAGDDKKYRYHNSTLALDVNTGEIVWHYQHLVDHWDLDHVFERILLDTKVAPDPYSVSWINPELKPGEKRKVVTGIPGKTGIIYTLDRETGEFLWATPTTRQNVVESIDGVSGEVSVNPDTLFQKVGDTRFVCPGMGGGKNWPAGSYSPLTGAMYFPLQNLCMDATVLPAGEGGEIPGPASLYGVMPNMRIAPGTDQLGSVWAIAADTGELLWKYEQRAPTLSLLATGGGLLFGGDANGRFRAHDQRSGEVLWETNLGSQVSGFPVSFAVDGRQYIAVSTGGSLSPAALLPLVPEIRPGIANTLYVFALPAKGPMPATRWRPIERQIEADKGAPRSTASEPTKSVQAGVYSQAQAARGERLYEKHCSACHGVSLAGTPASPPLLGVQMRYVWDGRSAGELFRLLRTTMPPGRAGSLDASEHAALLAFLLQRNGFPEAGNGELAAEAEALDDILLEWKADS